LAITVVVEELFAQIFDHYFGCPGLMGLFDYGVKVVALADVGDHGNDITAIVLLQPGNDDGGVKASGIS
jgi:hypothetical protein